MSNFFNVNRVLKASLFFLLVGCQQPVPPYISTNPNSATAISTNHAPSETTISISTPKPTVTETFSPAIPTVRLDSEKLCPERQEVEFVTLGIAPGHRLLFRRSSDLTQSLWAITGDSGQITLLPNTSHYSPVISPDGYWIADERFPTNSSFGEIRLLNFSGEQQTVLGLSRGIEIDTIQWVDERHIAIWQRLKDSVYGTYSLPKYILEPFTKEMKEMPLLPEMPRKNNLWLGPNADSAIYVEALSRDEYWILYFYQVSKQIKLLPSKGRYQFGWTVDGTKAAFFTAPNTGGRGLVLNIFDITVAKQIGAYEIDSSLNVDPPIWSPNGRFLAFATYTNDVGNLKRPPDISIFDTRTNKTFSYCSPPGIGAPLHWSKDSNFLTWTGNEGKSIVLDVSTGRFALLADMLVIDWGIYKK